MGVGAVSTLFSVSLSCLGSVGKNVLRLAVTGGARVGRYSLATASTSLRRSRGGNQKRET